MNLANCRMLLADIEANSRRPEERETASSSRHAVGARPEEQMMAARRKTIDEHANRLLGLLPAKDYRRLRPHLERIPLDYRQSLYRARRPLGFVYFIETGVGSLVNTMANGEAAEVGTIGNEGMVGLPLLLGDDRAPTSVYVQVPGAGLRMTAAQFDRELARSASMRTVMLRYAHALFNQVAQSAACNHFHSIQQRCCRWMLMTHDRMKSNEFLLTQEFLAMMLGVQRTGVSAAAGALKRLGLIRYRRGVVTILDRRGLQQRSCECYGVSRQEFDRLLGGPPRRKGRPYKGRFNRV
jgi:CRP-like cAMP-binding protein